MRMPVSVLILIALDLVLAGLALFGGVNLMMDPTGVTMQIDPTIGYIPFVSNFMPFAIWLVVAFAALPVILAFGLYYDKKWALYGSLGLAGLEIVWIATQAVLLYPLGIAGWWPVIISYAIVVAGIAAASVYLMLRSSVRTYFHWGMPRIKEPGS